MEAVVGMVVMAIIMGIVFIIFAIISERMLDFKNQNQYVADLNRLTYSVNKDIFENEKLIGLEDGFVFYAYSGTMTRYSRQEAYILRTRAEFVDTFKIPIQQLKFDTLTGRDKRIVFQRMAMEIDVNKQPMQLKFFKKIHANDLIKAIKE